MHAPCFQVEVEQTWEGRQRSHVRGKIAAWRWDGGRREIGEDISCVVLSLEQQPWLSKGCFPIISLHKKSPPWKKPVRFPACALVCVCVSVGRVVVQSHYVKEADCWGYFHLYFSIYVKMILLTLSFTHTIVSPLTSVGFFLGRSLLSGLPTPTIISSATQLPVRR